MRKLKRAIARHEAEKTGGKTSKVLRTMWHRYQEKKYGFKTAELLRKIGTGKRKCSRVAMRTLMRKGVVGR